MPKYAFIPTESVNNNKEINKMNAQPEKTCSFERLVTHPKSVAQVKSGVKTQQRRDGVYAWPGETFTLEGVDIVVTHLERKRLGDMTEDQARKEGYSSLDEYREIIMRMHPGMVWNPDSLVWVHSFKILDSD